MNDPLLPQPDAAGLTETELQTTLKVLSTLTKRPALLTSGNPRYQEVRNQAARLMRVSRDQEKREARQRDRDLLDLTGIRGETVQAQPEPTVSAPAAPLLSAPRDCYVCNRPFTRVHFFYDSLCPECAELNYRKREATADLTGRIALITGGRVKIGYQSALKLLRAGATVLATTRFPHDALRRYAHEPDFDAWSNRLTLHAIDLRHLAAVERFITYLDQKQPHLDILINNAAQTVRRPPAYYRHLLEEVQENLTSLPAAGRLLGYSPVEATALAAGILADSDEREAMWPALLSQVPLVPGDEQHAPDLFPPGEYDAHRQQLDLRSENSWYSKGEEISTVELIEVQAVNTMAPFLLITRLKPLLQRSPFPARYIVNVSAVEGKFNDQAKTGNHPHTNMAKAALNMITRTCADDYAEAGIYINSVDTGWISNEAPTPRAQQMEARGFRLPLDVIDAAARVCDPIFQGIQTGENRLGKYLKDYREASW